MSHANLSETLPGELGPVLLDRKVSQPDAVTTLGVGVVCLIVGAVLIAVGGAGFDGSLSFTLILGALLGLLGSVIFIVTFRTYWANRGTRQFVHERGLREESAREVICIGHDEADELEYRVTDLYNHGVYAGTFDQFALRMTGFPCKEIASPATHSATPIARDAFERITGWHQAARNLIAASWMGPRPTAIPRTALRSRSVIASPG